MKAIEILFNRIDELNTQIKEEHDIDNKVLIACEIQKTVEIIWSMHELKNQIYLKHWNRDYERDYL